MDTYINSKEFCSPRKVEIEINITQPSAPVLLFNKLTVSLDAHLEDKIHYTSKLTHDKSLLISTV